MPNEPLPPSYHVVTPEQDTRIEAEVNRLLVERDKANFEGFVDSPPGEGVFFPAPSPREELVFYEAQDEAYWANLYASYPDMARRAFRRFADLVGKYRHD